MWCILFCVVALQFTIYVSTQEFEFPKIEHDSKTASGTIMPDESVIFNSMDRVLNKTLRKVCALHGRAEAFNDVATAIEDSKGCVVGLTKKYALSFREAHYSDNWDIKSKIYCRFSNDLLSCLSGIFEATNGCLRPEQHGRLPKVLRAGLGYFCYNEGKRFSDFIKVGGDYCVMRELPDIKRCIHSSMADLLSNNNLVINEGNVTNPELQEEKCRVISDMKECIMDKIDDCPEPKVYDFMGGLFDASIEVTPCHQYMKDSFKLVEFGIGAFLVVLAIVILVLSIITLLKKRVSNQISFNKM